MQETLFPYPACASGDATQRATGLPQKHTGRPPHRRTAAQCDVTWPVVTRAHRPSTAFIVHRSPTCQASTPPDALIQCSAPGNVGSGSLPTMDRCNIDVASNEGLQVCQAVHRTLMFMGVGAGEPLSAVARSLKADCWDQHHKIWF